jgi:carbonic anhydrase
VSVIDDVVKANEGYAQGFALGHLPMPPARKLAVVACMDARMTVEPMLGLATGDAHLIRNAGGIVTEDAVRSLVISHYLLGTREFMVINHTDCGMLTFKDDELAAKLEETFGTAAVVPARFHAFTDVEENVRRQVEKVTSHPWMPNGVPVRGFVYEVGTGRLREVTPAARSARARQAG